MEFCTHEAILPNHFQKDRLKLVYTSYLCKRKKPSKYSSTLKSKNTNIYLHINGSAYGLRPTFKLEPNRRAVSESRLNVVDYSQSRLEDFTKVNNTSDYRKSTVLIQTWERRSQNEGKRPQTQANNHSVNCIQPYRTHSTLSNKDNLASDLKRTKSMLDRPLHVGHAMLPSKSDGNCINYNGVAKVPEMRREVHKRTNNKPRPKSLNLTASNGAVNEEPEWISLSRKLCAKFVRSHLDISSPKACHAKNGLTNVENGITNVENGIMNSRNGIMNTGNEITKAGNGIMNSRNGIVNTGNEITKAGNGIMNSRNGIMNTGNEITKAGNGIVNARNKIATAENRFTVQPTKNAIQTKPAKKVEEPTKNHFIYSVESKIPEKPQWIDLSRKLCTKFIEEHIQCEPCDMENQRTSPKLEIPKTDVRIIEKLGRRINIQEQKQKEQPEWITLSKKLRAKFIEGHRDDPDTISLENQLNASDLEEYGSDFKYHQSNSELRRQPLANEFFVVATNDRDSKIDTNQGYENRKDNSEVLRNGETTVHYSSDISHREKDSYKSPIYCFEEDNISQQPSIKSCNYQENEDVNYELTFETFDTQRPASESESPVGIAYEGHSISPQCHLNVSEDNTSIKRNKTSKSLSDLTSVFDCDSLENCHELKNGDSNTYLMVQNQFQSHENDYDYTKMENDCTSTRFTISNPERDKSVHYVIPISHNPIENSSILENLLIASNLQSPCSQQISPSSFGKDHHVPVTVQHPISPSKHTVLQVNSNNYIMNDYIPDQHASQLTPSTDNEYVDKSTSSGSTKTFQECNFHQSSSTTQVVDKRRKESEPIYNSSKHQPNNVTPVNEFKSRDNCLATYISDDDKCKQKDFVDNSFDDTLKHKIKILHYIENDRQDTDSKNTILVSDCSNHSFMPSGKPHLNEAIKKSHAKMPATEKKGTSRDTANGNSRIDLWPLPDQKGSLIKNTNHSFEEAEYENLPTGLLHESQRIYHCKSSESTYVGSKRFFTNNDENHNDFVPDNDSSYRPVNPPLEFEMFEMPSLCSPENQRILLNREPGIEINTDYGTDHLNNTKFSHTQYVDMRKNESSGSDTPNSTPFDAGTLVSPSSYASDSETSSWTLTKNNSYTINRSIVPETDVSDCSLSVKCDDTPSCSNQSTMESKRSNCTGADSVFVTSNGGSTKCHKANENRFSEVFVDCETAKNWKKSHSLDHLEDKFFTNDSRSSSFYAHMNNDSSQSFDLIPKKVEKTDSTEAMPESLRHLFNMPLNNPIYNSASKTSMLLSKTAEPPPSHYYSVTSSGSSSVKESKSSKKSKKSDRSSSLKIKDIAQGIILTFRKFHSHSKTSNVSPNHYVDVSHLAENHVSSNSHACQKDLQSTSDSKNHKGECSTYGKLHPNRTFNAGYFGHRSTSETNLNLSANSSNLCTCDNFVPSKSSLEVDERSNSFNFGKLAEAKRHKAQKITSEMKEKKNKNHHGGKSRSKKSEPKATSSVSRKVQQMADGTLYLVTTVSGDTAVPGVYSDSPDTGSEISSHAPTKRPGESNC